MWLTPKAVVSDQSTRPVFFSRVAQCCMPRRGGCSPEEYAKLSSSFHDFRRPLTEEERIKLRFGGASEDAAAETMPDFALALPWRWRHIAGMDIKDRFRDVDIVCTTDLKHGPRGQSKHCCALQSVHDVLLRVDSHLSRSAAAGRLQTATWRRLRDEAVASKHRERRRTLMKIGVPRRSRKASMAAAARSAEEARQISQALGISAEQA
eukprot:Hpha_TRINITY_DN1138_c0_g1::TRINITY_DN1138_c0_g1_i2::g.113195::m.113195